MRIRTTFMPPVLLCALVIVALATIALTPPYGDFQPRIDDRARAAEAATVAQALRAFYVARGCYPQPTQTFGEAPKDLLPYLHATAMAPYLQYVTANARNQWVIGSGLSVHLVYINYQPGNATANVYVVGSTGTHGPTPSKSPAKLCETPNK